MMRGQLSSDSLSPESSSASWKSRQNFKNVYMMAHGLRIKDSFFKLEPNVNVYMKCSDTIATSTPFINSIIMKYILKNDGNIEYLDTIIKKIRSKKILDGKITYNSGYQRIIKEINTTKNIVTEDLRFLLLSNSKKIQKLDEFYQKLEKRKREGENQVQIKVKNLIQKLVINNVKINDVIQNVLEDSDNYGKFEKIKSIHKPSYDLLQKYKNIKERFEKKRSKMERRYINYDIYFDYCVFSGNIDHNVRKYTHGDLCSKKKMDINICPNICFSAEDGEKFRDFICEQGVRMEIKKNNETYINHEDIIKIIDKYIMEVFRKEDESVLFDFNNFDGLSMIINSDIQYLKEESIKLKNRLELMMDSDKKKLDEIKRYVAGLKTNSQIRFFEKNVKKLEEKIEEKEKKVKRYTDLINSYYEWSVDNSKKLFYPFGTWTDCNVKEEFRDIVNDFMERGHFCNRFQYYDPVKRRFLSETECIKKCKSERAKYGKYNNVSLRDVLLYLYYHYKMHEDPTICLELTLTACKSFHQIPKGIYNTCKLSLSDYIHRQFKINGKRTTLREYDKGNRYGSLLNPPAKKKRIRRSCSSIAVKDGCPSHCELPKDPSRKTCIVKSRRRKIKGTA